MITRNKHLRGENRTCYCKLICILEPQSSFQVIRTGSHVEFLSSGQNVKKSFILDILHLPTSFKPSKFCQNNSLICIGSAGVHRSVGSLLYIEKSRSEGAMQSKQHLRS